MMQKAVLVILLLGSGLGAHGYRGFLAPNIPCLRSTRCNSDRSLSMTRSDKEPRKIVRYDNVGDPVYEDELDSSSSGMSVLGLKLSLDPLSLSLLIFGAIAFNFFVLANL